VLDFLDNMARFKPTGLHYDSGSEFINDGLRKGLTSRGIILTHIAGYAYEQNGITERNVRTIIEKMRAL